MGLGNLFKLEKLKITAYKTIQRNKTDQVSDPFEVMFNPESITQNFEILYGRNQAIGTSDSQKRYARSNPSDLSLSLVLDSSGTTEMGGITDTVSDRVNNFIKLAFDMNGGIHQPNFLVLEWGDIKNFNCRLGSLNIRYTSFDRQGKPLRADLDIKLISDESAEDLQKKNKLTSPDLSHSRIVKAGDTLPLLSKEMYGSSAYYLWVAKANGLDEIRHLTPGQQLLFPPLESQSGH